MPRAQELERLLDSTTSERPILGWVKKNASVLPHTMTGCAIPSYVVAEFPFGSDFRADFVMIGPFSGGCDVHFIELEAPHALLFTRKGKPAKRLSDAITQILDWKIFVEKERHTVLRELSKFATTRELIWGRDRNGITDNTGMELYNPNLFVNWWYHIIIGRRSTLSEPDLGRKAAFFHAQRVEVATYDRLIEAARKLDKYDPFQAGK
jgi:Domain of unknown function (DUF4263)